MAGDATPELFEVVLVGDRTWLGLGASDEQGAQPLAVLVAADSSRTYSLVDP